MKDPAHLPPRPLLGARPVRTLGALAALLTLFAPSSGAGQTFEDEEQAEATLEPHIGPSPTSFDHFQYGGALVAEPVPFPGDVCPPDATRPCILQGGGGLAIRAGYRSRFPWYVGGAYEFSRQDSSNLLVLPILQQLRAEARYYWDRGQRLLPYGLAGLGGAMYGSEWGLDTAGVVALLGAGLEFQITPVLVVGGSLTYRPLFLKAWTDSAGQRRSDAFAGFGVSHLIALELGVELRDPLPRW